MNSDEGWIFSEISHAPFFEINSKSPSINADLAASVKDRTME